MASGSWTTGAVSNLARKFEFLQDRAQRRPIREGPMDLQSDPSKRQTSIGHLKEFYLQRLAKAEPATAARLGGTGTQGSVGSGELGRAAPAVARPTFSPAAAENDSEDMEIMCNNCFTLIKASEAEEHGNVCFININRQGQGNFCTPIRPGVDGQADAIAKLDVKLSKLRVALESRLQDASSKVNVMRHLTQLRYHIDTATKWAQGCSEIGALSDHTVQQVKQLTATSRVLAPAVYIFSKRIENVIVQKERELRKASNEGGQLPNGLLDTTIDSNVGNQSVADVSSIVSELDSDCGTQYPETVVTQDKQSMPSTDVGNVQDANDYLSLKNEDEQRRWFYSQCLTVKLSCTDQAKARRILISDLYTKVKAENVPIEGWVQWIRSQLVEDGVSGSPMGSSQPQDGGAAPADKAAGFPAPIASGSTALGGLPMHSSGATTPRSFGSSSLASVSSTAPWSARGAADPLGPTRPVSAMVGGGGQSLAGALASPRPGQVAGFTAHGGVTRPASGFNTYDKLGGLQAMRTQYTSPMLPGQGPLTPRS